MSTPGDLLRALQQRGSGGLDSDGERLGDLAAGTEPTRIYRGRSVDELIPRIQSDLGGDAIILRRRQGLTGGVLGFFQHAYVEIEAMAGTPRLDVYDEVESVAPPPAQPPPPSPPAGPPAPGSYTSALAQPPTPSGPPPARPAPPRPAAPAPPPIALTYGRQQPAPAPGPSAYVTAHLAALARTQPATAEQRPPAPAPTVDFGELIPRPAPRAPPSRPAPASLESEPLASERRIVAPGSHARARAGVERSLCRLGISEELARDLIDAATAHTLPLAPRLGLAQAVRTTLAERMPVAPALPTTGAVVVLVGTGGAGKTTCAAALLAAYRANSTLPASFATLLADHERGELQMILSPQLLRPTPAGTPRAQRVLARARSEGLAVVDTPRLTPADRAGIRKLARLLGQIRPERIVLALPATLSAAAAAQLLTALRPLRANSLAVTHVDETDQLGVAVEVACRFGLAPEYMLEGRRGGGFRLQRTDPRELAERLLP